MKKGDCFSVAARLQADNPEWLLCHGIVTHPETGRHWHAWCEYTETVPVPDGWPASYGKEFTYGLAVDKANGNDVVLPTDAYYRIGGVNHWEVWRYDRIEAATLMLRHQHWGPWEGPVDLP